MKKKWFLILGVILIVLIALVLVFVFFINGRTLEEITTGRFGGRLTFELDYYTVYKVHFESTSKSGDTHEGLCVVWTYHYKKSSASPTGKIIDYCETEEIPCSFTSSTLILNGIDRYDYKVVKSNGIKYVEFSKPFMGLTSWEIDR